MTEREVRRPTSQPPREDVYGGAGHIWANNPYFDPYAPSRNIPVPNPAMEEIPTNNPSHLNPKMLEKVAEVIDNNVEKIFPGADTLEIWMKVKNENAYKLMNTPEDKVDQLHKPLFNYLKQLKEATGLGPKSGVTEMKPESVEKYMERALQNAASKKLLDTLELQ